MIQTIHILDLQNGGKFKKEDIESSQGHHICGCRPICRAVRPRPGHGPSRQLARKILIEVPIRYLLNIKYFGPKVRSLWEPLPWPRASESHDMGEGSFQLLSISVALIGG
jgi:hypothetical protein